MIQVETTQEALAAQAQQLEAALSLNHGFNIKPNAFKLKLTTEGLFLYWLEQPGFTPFKICFTTGKQAWRVQNSGRQEAVVRAVGVVKGKRPQVLDATAGLGRDAMILAAAGCSVALLERHPVIHALLADAWARAKNEAQVRDGMIERVTLLPAGSLLNLSFTLDFVPDVIYLDPMYPSRTKSAAVKKEMQILQALVGEDLDSDKLLPAALSLAAQRVVVKRPIQADYLNQLPPHSQVKSKKHRFDIYIKP